ncbi:MAG: flippase-like domain-containing protein [Pseudomonadota bacterium]|nr:MAG: flippase-like domain-containing protein [Pseudomonadota bacterium]
MRKKLTYLAWFGGIGLFLALIFQQGIGEVLVAFASVGWGLLGVALYRFVPLSVHTLGWYMLLPQPHRQTPSGLFRMRWICEAVNTLLPVAQVGGELVRARLLARSDMRRSVAAASVAADFTLGLLSQLVFTFIGIALLLDRTGSADLVTQFALVAMVAALLVLAFFYLQHRGLFSGGMKLMGVVVRSEQWSALVGSAASLDNALRDLYRNRGAVARSAFIRLGAWLLGTGETWIALHLLGAPVSFTDALIIESLGYAARSLGFLVPGALGIMEGAIMLVGTLLGVTPATALALSLVKRVRELAIGAPALLLWARQEARGTKPVTEA